MAIGLSVSAQKADANMANAANPSTSIAQKATIEWVKLYDLSGEQVKEALNIQQAKYRNFADIESLKASNLTFYVQKRIAALEIAEGELRLLLDETQQRKYVQQQVYRAGQLEQITMGLKKQGYADNEINKKITAPGV